MAEFVKVDTDPNEIRGTGAMIRSMAETFGTEVQGILGEINSTDASRPWGADEFGEAFDRDVYNAAGEDGTAFSTAVKDSMTGAGKTMTGTGGRVVRAMDGYQLVDTEGANNIKSVEI